MVRPLRSALLFAILSLWLSSAGAFCVSEAVYEYVMRAGDEPTPEQSLPCCVSSSRFATAARKEGSPRGEGAASQAGAVLVPAPGLPTVTLAIASPLRWRAYCDRSCRLLR